MIDLVIASAMMILIVVILCPCGKTARMHCRGARIMHGMRLMIQIDNKNDNGNKSCLLTGKVTVACSGLYVGLSKSIW